MRAQLGAQVDSAVCCVDEGFITQPFSCTYNETDCVYELASLITVHILSIPFFTAAEFVDYASAVGFISPLLETQNIKNCFFVLFDLNAAKMRFNVLEHVPFEGIKLVFVALITLMRHAQKSTCLRTWSY